MNNGLHVMNLLFLSDFNGSWISRQIFEKLLNYIMKIHPVGTALFHVVKQTDEHKEANGRF